MLMTNPIEPLHDSKPGRWPGVPGWVHACAWGGLVALIFFLVVVARHYDGRNFWSGWTEGRELRKPGYMERIYPNDFLRTRANSWSNLAYVLVGFYAFGLGIHDLRRGLPGKSGYLVNTPPMNFLFGAMCCCLGFGSGFYHASLTRIGQQVDVASMYVPLLALIAISLGGWLKRVKSGGSGVAVTWVLATLVLVTGYLLFEHKWSMSSVKVLSTLILTVTILSLLEEFISRRRKTYGWLIFSAATLVAARVCWQLDVAKKFSGPDAWIQGHAVWHLLTALSLATIYFYFRLETRGDDRAISPP